MNRNKGFKYKLLSAAGFGRGLFYCLAVFFPSFLFSRSPSGVSAGDYSRNAIASTSGQFLKLAPGARGVAMGEAFSAMGDDASAMYWNPACLINVSSHSLVLMHAPYLADSFFDYAAYAQNKDGSNAWGISLQYMNSGAITRTDVNGVELDKFTPMDGALSLGFATYITGFKKEPEERFVLGATAKIVYSKVVHSDNAIAADVGILFPYFFDNKFRMAAVVQNAMGRLRLDQESFPLPMTFRFGTWTKLYRYWGVTADLVAPRDNYPYLAMGTEVKIPVMDWAVLAVRGGFNTRAVSDLEGFRNISFGAGITSYFLSLDYAFTPFGVLGSAQRVSLSFNF